MRKTEKFIRHYNRLNGKPIRKKTLVKLHADLKKEISAGRIDAHCPGGIECIEIEKKLSRAISKMNGRYDIVQKLELKTIPIKQNVIITQTVRGPEVVKKKLNAPSSVQKKKVKKVMREFKRGDLKTESGKKVTEQKQAVAIAMNEAGIKKKSSPSSLGFVSSDQAPEKPNNLIRLKGPIGDFLQDLQPYKLVIVAAGETHSSKSQLGMQIADAFASAGYDVGVADWEQGGVQSADTQRSLANNVKAENRKRIHISSEVPKTLEAVKSLAKQFKVVVLDSGTKLDQVTNAWIDQLRDEHPETIWVILMQQNAQGRTRGGSAAEFDAPVVIFTYRPDPGDYKKNYAQLFKNRGNKTDLYYSMAEKKIIQKPKN